MVFSRRLHDRSRSVRCCENYFSPRAGNHHSQDAPRCPASQRRSHNSNKERSIMSEPFLGEIKIISWNYAPNGWALCNGQLLPINQNQALFSLLGTTFGGNGQTTFALPDLRGRTPISF